MLGEDTGKRWNKPESAKSVLFFSGHHPFYAVSSTGDDGRNQHKEFKNCATRHKRESARDRDTLPNQESIRRSNSTDFMGDKRDTKGGGWR